MNRGEYLDIQFCEIIEGMAGREVVRSASDILQNGKRNTRDCMPSL